jgi:hypothetical protein
VAAVAEVSLYLLQLRFELEILCGWFEFLVLLSLEYGLVSWRAWEENVIDVLEPLSNVCPM